MTVLVRLQAKYAQSEDAPSELTGAIKMHCAVVTMLKPLKHRHFDCVKQAEQDFLNECRSPSADLRIMLYSAKETFLKDQYNDILKNFTLYTNGYRVLDTSQAIVDACGRPSVDTIADAVADVFPVIEGIDDIREGVRPGDTLALEVAIQTLVAATWSVVQLEVLEKRLSIDAGPAR